MSLVDNSAIDAPVSTAPPPSPIPPRFHRRRRGLAVARWLVVLGLPLGLIIVANQLLLEQPAFYVERLAAADLREQKQLSNQFVNKGSRLFTEIQTMPEWTADLTEAEINAWLAEDFAANHAQQSLPKAVAAPRVAMEGEVLRVGFRYTKGPLSTVVQIALRAWVPKRFLLAIELQEARAGALRLPTNYTRHVIEQFCHANNMEITWKRNQQHLVALISFPRGHRDIILKRVAVRQGGILLKGASGRAFPSTDYAPSAN